MTWTSRHCMLSVTSLQRRHNEHDGVSNHQPYDCLLSRLFRRRSKKTSKLRVTGLCAGNSPVTGEFPHKGPVTRKMFPFDDVITKRGIVSAAQSGWWQARKGATRLQSSCEDSWIRYPSGPGQISRKVSSFPAVSVRNNCVTNNPQESYKHHKSLVTQRNDIIM